MTGPEHYRQAEQLLGNADIAAGQFEERGWESKRLIADRLTAQAQVHATLALAATQVDCAVMRPADRHQWLKATDREYAAQQAAEVTP